MKDLDFSDWTIDGIDNLQFKVSFNKGQEALPLSQFISGGELSRLLLAFQGYIQRLQCYSLLIFDEINMIFFLFQYVYAPGYPPVLFDLVNDPDELNDLGINPEYDEVRRMMFEKLAEWSLQYRQRQTWSEEHNLHMTGIEEKLGVMIGYWDEEDAKAKGKDSNMFPKRKGSKEVKD